MKSAARVTVLSPREVAGARMLSARLKSCDYTLNCCGIQLVAERTSEVTRFFSKKNAQGKGPWADREYRPDNLPIRDNFVGEAVPSKS